MGSKIPKELQKLLDEKFGNGGRWMKCPKRYMGVVHKETVMSEPIDVTMEICDCPEHQCTPGKYWVPFKKKSKK